MNRIRQMKNLMTRLRKRNFQPKPKYTYTPKPLTPEQKELKKKYDCEHQRKFRIRRRSNGQCEKCENPAVKITYSYLGKDLITRLSYLCPTHWEALTIRKEMQDAIATNTTISTVHPMVTLKPESYANYTNKQLVTSNGS